MMNRYENNKTSHYCFWLIVGVFLWVSSAAAAAEISSGEIARNLQESYNKISTLEASFVQETYSKFGSRKRVGNGSLILKKPGLMRWDYQTPDRQVFICDGERLSMYFAKENQMLTSSAKQYLESDVMYSFFAGSADIVRDFDIAESTDLEQDIDDMSYQVKLVPKKSHPQIDEINIWVDRTSYLLQRLKVLDKFGSITDLVFSDITQNKNVDKANFLFVPPDGTEIINQ